MNDINSHNSIELRRMQDNLVHAGAGYIVFGVWSLIKLFMMMTMQSEYTEMLNDSLGDDPEERAFLLIITAVFFFVVVAFTIWIHLWIGRGAMRYGRGLSRKKTFVVLSVIGIVINILALPMYFWDFVNGTQARTDDTTIASILVDITVNFIFLDMIVSTARIDRLMKSPDPDETVETQE